MDELNHYGVKGMKWGVRRYQSKNGTLTPAGRKRYISDKTRGFQKDIDSFKPYTKTGLRDKHGRLMLSSKDVQDSIKALEANRDRRALKYGKRYDRKMQKEHTRIDKAYKKHMDKAMAEVSKSRDKFVSEAVDRANAKIQGGAYSKFEKQYVRKHGAPKTDSAKSDMTQAYMNYYANIMDREYNRIQLAAFRSNSSYKKAKAMADKYAMNSWSDVAKENAKTISAVESAIHNFEKEYEKR